MKNFNIQYLLAKEEYGGGIVEHSRGRYLFLPKKRLTFCIGRNNQFQNSWLLSKI